MKKEHLVILIAVLLAGLSFSRGCVTPQPGEVTIKRDTIVRVDTIRIPPPPPDTIKVVRTIKVPVEVYAVDTITNTVMVELPIERKTYTTEAYRATIEGYRPQLIDVEVYTPVTTITNTEVKLKRPRWAVTVGGGVGYTPKGLQPYVGVSVGYVIWSR